MAAKSSNAFLWKSAGAIANQGIAFCFTILLARKLMPADFGFVAAAMSVIHIAKIFINIGLSEALIQNKETNQITFSSVFVLNAIIGAILFIIIFCSAPLLADFLEDKRLTNIVRIISTIVLFDSLTVVQRALLSKGLEFDKLVKTSLITQSFSGLLAIGFLYLGYEIYALVVQNISISFISAILLWRISDWRPNIVFNKAEVMKLYEYTKYSFLTLLTNNGFKNVVPIIIAKSFSANTLGFYRRADSLVKMVINIINDSVRQVLFAQLSRMQEDSKASSRVFEISLELVVVLAAFFSAQVYLCSELFFLEILGDQWAESLPIFRILIFLGLLEPFQLVINSATLSKGLSKMNYYAQTSRRVFDLTSLAIGLIFGFFPFLYAIIVSSLVGALVYIRIGDRVFLNSVRRVLKRAIIPVGVIICLVYSLETRLELDNLWALTTSKVLIMTSAFGVFFFFFRKKFILSLIQIITHKN